MARLLMIVAATLLCFGGLVACTDSTTSSTYGVFIGLDPEDSELLLNYSTVVIDAEYYSKEEIATITQAGVTVYSYLNIGSIETFRDSYPWFEDHALGTYDNWPGEYWMDVSNPAWQDHIASFARMLVAKGIDGFFLDNTDVYYEYQRTDIFQGLITIINDLEKLNVDIVINGGDTFVSEAVLDPATPRVHITGVNQETVFSGIDFANNTLGVQDPDSTEYFQDYLRRCKDAGLAVCVTEYVDPSNAQLRETISDYCEHHDYQCFIASSIELSRA